LNKNVATHPETKGLSHFQKKLATLNLKTLMCDVFAQGGDEL